MYKNRLTISKENLEKNEDKLVALECGCVLTLGELYERGEGPCPCYFSWVEVDEFPDLAGRIVQFTPYDNKWAPVTPPPHTHPTPTDQPLTSSSM